MPGTVTVTAIRDFEYAGLRHLRGDPVIMPPLAAAVAAQRGQVSLTVGIRVARTRTIRRQAITFHDEHLGEVRTRQRRQYQRRDLEAEP